MFRSRLLTVLVLTAVTALPAAAQKLDEGRFDPSWFSGAGEFRVLDEIDYIWVADGFSTAGKKIAIDAWSEPEWLGEKRDGKDAAAAEEMTERAPSMFKGSLKAGLAGRSEIVSEGGDYRITGRFVDVSAGSTAAKWVVGFGAGSATGTFDVKITDKAGKTVVAIHHRVISGTVMSELGDKIVKWIAEEFTPGMETDFAGYAKGKKAKK